MQQRSVNYLMGYPEHLQAQARQLLEQGKLGPLLLRKYPGAHALRTDKALYSYVQEMKTAYMRNGAQIDKVAYDGKLEVLRHALGQHSFASRVQGGKLKAKHEIRIASVFRDMPEAFLKMIVAHELAHLKEKEHNKAFYQLCSHMEPEYHQLEFDVRLYLSYRDSGGEALWGNQAN
jgi:predicted metal-dependent hydrolase